MNARGIRKKEPLDTAFSLSKPTVLASAIGKLIEAKIKMPSEIAEELFLNAEDIESLCAVPSGTLQNKVVTLRFAN
jgi:hypothetical protein